MTAKCVIHNVDRTAKGACTLCDAAAQIEIGQAHLQHNEDLKAIEGSPAHEIIRLRRAAITVCQIWGDVEQVIAETTAPTQRQMIGIGDDDLARWRRLFVHLRATGSAIVTLREAIGR